MRRDALYRTVMAGCFDSPALVAVVVAVRDSVPLWRVGADLRATAHDHSDARSGVSAVVADAGVEVSAVGELGSTTVGWGELGQALTVAVRRESIARIVSAFDVTRTAPTERGGEVAEAFDQADGTVTRELSGLVDRAVQAALDPASGETPTVTAAALARIERYRTPAMVTGAGGAR